MDSQHVFIYLLVGLGGLALTLWLSYAVIKAAVRNALIDTVNDLAVKGYLPEPNEWVRR